MSETSTEITEADVAEQAWFTRAELAEYARVKTRTVDRWVQNGMITRYRIKGVASSVRFKKTEVDALFQVDAEDDPFAEDD